MIDWTHRLINTRSGEYWCMSSAMSTASSIRMDKLGEYRLGKHKWVQCWVHILNLVVPTIFMYFNSTTELRFTDLRPESKGKDPLVEDQQQFLTTCVIWFSDDDTAKNTLGQKKCKATEQLSGQTKLAEPKGKDRGGRGWQAAIGAHFVNMTDRVVEDIYWEVHVQVETGQHRKDKEEVDHWPTREETSSDHYTQSYEHQSSEVGQTVPLQPEKIQTDLKYNIKKENHLNQGDF
ncbi:hypothetical protein JCM1841_001206 [Sporobolomyces salmonicolor]